jgi:transaldolase
LLFSPAQYLAAAEAYMRGIERRIKANLDLCVTSVASIFISRWDVAVNSQVAERLRNRLGIAMGQSTYRAYGELLHSPRWLKLVAAGARQQRLLWASTGTKDPDASDTLYVEALAAPGTIDTIPEKTLLAFAEHGVLNSQLVTGGEASSMELSHFIDAGIDIDALALQLQREGAESFVKSWNKLLQRIEEKSVPVQL